MKRLGLVLTGFLVALAVSTAAFASTQNNYQQVMQMEEIPANAEDINSNAVKVFSAARLVLEKTRPSAEVNKILQLMSELTVSISPEEASSTSSEEATKKIKQRLNENYKDRYWVVERMAKIMNKYRSTYPKTVEKYIPNLHLLAKYDWSTQVRRLAMLAVVSLDKNRNRVYALLEFMQKYDGQKVIDASSRGGIMAKVVSGRTQQGETIFKIELAAKLTQQQDSSGKTLINIDNDMFSGTSEQIRIAYAQVFPQLKKDTESVLAELKDPSSALAKKISAQELQALREKRTRITAGIARSCADKDDRIKMNDCRAEQQALLSVVQEIDAVTSSGIPQDLASELEVELVYAAEISSKLASGDRKALREMANGVTEAMSDRTKEWATELKKRFSARQALDLRTLIARGSESKLLLLANPEQDEGILADEIFDGIFEDEGGLEE